jgi:hypothetical protein
LEKEMTGSTQVTAKEISSKWGKLTEAEASSIKNLDSLSAQVAKSYNLDKPKADAEVKAWMAGRTF